MTISGELFIYIGTYPTREAAESDYEQVWGLHASGAVGTYDAAIVTKDTDGTVHVHKVEMATRHAGWSGAVAGAMVGVLFPPVIIGTAIVGGAVGALSGHLWRGMSRSDVKELGEVVDGGEVALVVVGENNLEQTLDPQVFAAERLVVKNVTVDPDALDSALAEAAREIS
jgi:uncharacterized membrane protein